jgi:CPA2 family monovalent cation:H+ antiporter-2
MHNLDLILTLTGGLAAALVCGYLTHRLKLSPIVGYLLAGIVVGPHTPGFNANQGLAEQFAEIGVILLLFGVGLDFHLEHLLKVRKLVVRGGLIQITWTATLTTLLTLALGWELEAGFVFGLSLSVASTVVMVRVLADNRALHTPTGHSALGWLVVEDLVVVVLLVLLPALVGGGAVAESAAAAGHAVGPDSPHILWLLLGAFVKILGAVAVIFLIGGRVLPWLIERVVLTRSRELFTLAVLVIALGLAVGAAQLFGVSMALGAFLAGMVVGRSEFSLRAISEALPLRDAFSVLFFVSIGMLLNPMAVLEQPGLVLITLGIVMVAKPIAVFSLVLILKHPPRLALSIAVALAQIGEFSFILALRGRELGVFDESATQALVAASILSISLNPLLFRIVRPLELHMRKRNGWWLRMEQRSDPGLVHEARRRADVPKERKHRAIVIGSGPVGRTLTRLLLDNEIDPVAIELNLDTVRELRRQGLRAVYGDATHADTLKQAGIEQANTLILSASGLHTSREIVRTARELNPKIRVMARADYLREVEVLRAAGVQQAFSGEGEIALAMTTAILQELGASPEQIDRERDRVHTELGVSSQAPTERPATDEDTG